MKNQNHAQRRMPVIELLTGNNARRPQKTIDEVCGDPPGTFKKHLKKEKEQIRLDNKIQRDRILKRNLSTLTVLNGGNYRERPMLVEHDALNNEPKCYRISQKVAEALERSGIPCGS